MDTPATAGRPAAEPQRVILRVARAAFKRPALFHIPCTKFLHARGGTWVCGAQFAFLFLSLTQRLLLGSGGGDGRATVIRRKNQTGENRVDGILDVRPRVLFAAAEETATDEEA